MPLGGGGGAVSNSALPVSEDTDSEGMEEITVDFSPFSSENCSEAMLVDGRCREVIVMEELTW